ncbi:MAG: DNA polymerase III subunit gamma/tau [Eubacterium sp.]|nr:DNA polymerase III subunit gamma/tau [Eubacterium sp.]
MSYTALYRKYRPQNFTDVKGQDAIVTTICNQIKAERIAHAYLFCGTRGTGKTTIAKIFAKAVNCEHPVNGSPCGTCSSCQSIAAGTSMNVIEIDAASNNGVDNIREIRDEVTYAPTEGRYKVYIIDEVHMLSIGAFNALLKTLEEPPSYVIFILATTEAHKIPVTILSRCQRYDFHRISITIIAERLQDLLEQEQAEAEPKAIRYIAKAADGAMRDALSLLDQCMAFYMGQKLTYDQVLEVLGAVDTERFSRMLRSVVNHQVAEAMRQIEELVAEGRDLSQFVNDFTWYLRNLLLLQSSDDMEDVLDISSENLQLLKEECTMLDSAELMRYIRIFSELSSQVRYSTQKRILIEIAVIKLCRPQMEEDVSSILARLTQLEKKLEGGVVQPAEVMPETTADLPKAPLPKAISEDIRQVVENWRNIVSQMPHTIRVFIQKAHLSVGEDDVLMIVLDDSILCDMLSEEERLKEITDTISKCIGKQIQIQIKYNNTGQSFEQAFVDLEQMIHTEIEYEDF